jgi:hypothetical protein
MMTVAPPTQLDMLTATQLAARVLDTRVAFEVGDTTYFELGDGWLLGLRPDSARRVRVLACYGTTEVASLWASARDHGRLAALVRGLRDEVTAYVA